MNGDTVALVRASWKKVEPIAPEAAAQFYDNLFASDPNLKALFKGDLQQQGQRLMQTARPTTTAAHRMGRAAQGRGVSVPVSRDLAAGQRPLTISVRLSPHVVRVTMPNPGPMTGPGTNSYLVGAGAQ